MFCSSCGAKFEGNGDLCPNCQVKNGTKGQGQQFNARPNQSGNTYPGQPGNVRFNQGGNAYPGQPGNARPNQPGNAYPGQSGNVYASQTGTPYAVRSGNTQGYPYGAQPNANYYNMPPQPKKSNGKTGLIIGLCIALLLIVILAAILLLKKDKDTDETSASGQEEQTASDTVSMDAPTAATEQIAVTEAAPTETVRAAKLLYHFADYEGGVNSEYVTNYVDDGNNYYCWDDGTVSWTETYDPNSTTRWEIDKEGVVTVSGSYGVIAIYNPNMHREPRVGDRDGSHTIKALVNNVDTGTTYVLWDNSEGAVTFDGKYSTSSGLIWTHPDNKRGYIIYSGRVGQDNVVYSESVCEWCRNHKVYWYTYLTEYTWSTERQYLFCENCHDVMMIDHQQCAKETGHYYPTDMMIWIDGKWYCPKHW